MTEKVFGSEKKGSIQDIPLPQDNLSDNTLDLQENQDGGARNVDGWSSAKRKNRRSRAKYLILLLVGLGCIALYSWLFHSATVLVISKTQSVTVTEQTFSAGLDAAEGLGFIRVNPFNKTISSHVEGSQEENRQTKSSGLITVFNTDSNTKNYIKNTRFQTEDGRVYRAFQRFVIPKGTSEKPGSVDVLVYAENPGEKYNAESGLSFKLPALKENGDDAYDKVSAKQKEPLTGGFSGIIKVPTKDDIDEVKAVLKERITKDLHTEFRDAIPAKQYVANKDYQTVSDVIFTEKPNTQKGGLDIEARAELNSIVFKRADFDSFMASQVMSDVENTEGIKITNIDELTMTIKDDSFEPQTAKSFDFVLTGEIDFVWEVNAEETAALLAGKLESHVNNGLVPGLQNTSSIEAETSPFWRRSLPSDPSKIEVVIN